MNKSEPALSCFKQGFSCSQSVASAYGEQFGLNRELALKVSSAFGGGMGGMAEICGYRCIYGHRCNNHCITN